MSYYDRPNMHMSYAVGPADLTAWRNADAILVTGELQEMDDMVEVNIGNPLPVMEEYYPVGTSRYGLKLLNKGRTVGNLTTTHKGQTGRLIHWHMQACATTGSDPYTHAMTLNTTQVPIFLGFHAEREFVSKDRRYDMLGILPQEFHWKCPDAGAVEQTSKMQVAYANKSGGDIAKKTGNAKEVFTWDNLMQGGITFNYGEIGRAHV